MKDKYSHRERIEMIIAGERPDRFAASFWRHFFHLENNASGTAEATISFQKHFDWDFVKVNPRADYHTQLWGLQLKYSSNEFKKHIKSGFPIKTPDDWQKIVPMDLEAPVLAEHLKAVSLIRRGVGPDIPILMTIFTPLSVAGRLVAKHSLLVEHLQSYPEKVIPALEAITATFSRFATELRNAGADGLFYATTHWASSDKLTFTEYERFGVPYDLEVIKNSQEGALNLLHICGSNNYLSELVDLDYRYQLCNWDDSDPTNLSLLKANESLSGKVMVGGVEQDGWLLNETPNQVIDRIVELKRQHDPCRLIVGPGCAVAPEVPAENLTVIRANL